MAGLSKSASAGAIGGSSGRAALARVGLAGSFLECFAGSRPGFFGAPGLPGVFAMPRIWAADQGEGRDPPRAYTGGRRPSMDYARIDAQAQLTQLTVVVALIHPTTESPYVVSTRAPINGILGPINLSSRPRTGTKELDPARGACRLHSQKPGIARNRHRLSAL